MEYGYSESETVTVTLEPDTIERIDELAAARPLADRNSVIHDMLGTWLRQQNRF
ncbi:MAG: ribbon-helix-helix protein, CopG family [Natrialbaceae archaeon]|nr:ribbon-helix-helix protein, CopG family [Natrialbaceae archaeon]